MRSRRWCKLMTRDREGASRKALCSAAWDPKSVLALPVYPWSVSPVPQPDMSTNLERGAIMETSEHWRR